MQFIIKNIIIFTAIILIGGCGVVPRSAGPAGSIKSAESSDSSSIPMAASVSSVNEARSSLMQAYREWKGTPYVLGGSSSRGVDCSSFVRLVFDNYFDVDLPTNTRTQLNAGSGIRRTSLQTGDLVFFRTGRKTLACRHHHKR